MKKEKIRKRGYLFHVTRHKNGKFKTLKKILSKGKKREASAKSSYRKKESSWKKSVKGKKTGKQKTFPRSSRGEKAKYRDNPNQGRQDYIRITKNNVIERIKLTNVTEFNMRKPIRGKKGVMQIRFKFLKSVHGGKLMAVERTGRSNKLFFPKSFNTGYNQCLKRAMGQNLPFSPDYVKIMKISYFFWIPLK